MRFNFSFFYGKPYFLYLSLISLILFFNYFLITQTKCWAQDKLNTKQADIQQSNAQGSFYPADKNDLNEMLDLLLNSPKENIIKDHIYGIVSPHAGYIYSGTVAAQHYQAINNTDYKTVIILAPSHYLNLDSAAVYSQGFFQTPLGLVAIDQEFAQQLIENNANLFRHNSAAFNQEHSIEVQIPFLQKSLQDFQIVPIIIPHTSYRFTQSVAQALTQQISSREDVLIIASSDMSHYHDQQSANKIDKQTINLILNSEPKQLFDRVQQAKSELCGSSAVITLIQIMRNLQADNIQLLKYATSADSVYVAIPDKNRVVGYASIIFTKKNKLSQQNKSSQRSENMFNNAQKKELLTIARNSIVNIVKNKQKHIVLTDDKLLLEPRGAFVTISEDDSLRGCIGMIESDKPLINVVNDMAIQAATKDPRFTPVSLEELDKISLEISVMSPVAQVTDINQIEVGKHGLIIHNGYNSGLLLPQVATEYNWTREQFLAQACVKAGLDPDAWKQGAKIFIFSAEVFGEKK